MSAGKVIAACYLSVAGVMAVNADVIPRRFLKPDEVAINKEVQAKKRACNIPGVRVYVEKKAI